MTQQELTLYNLGENLDKLANLDPRGYGVCNILYEASRKHVGYPTIMSAAKKLFSAVKEGDVVYILTGFVLLPWKVAEMDGVVSSVLLCRALVKGLGAKPVIICPEDNLAAVEKLAARVGLHLYRTVDEVKQYPCAMGVAAFTKNADEADRLAESYLKAGDPKAVIAIEAPGANAKGVYHNAVGLDTTAIEAKMDSLFIKARERGILNIAIGDLGNEIGMAAIRPQLETFIPYAGEGRCRCGCGGGIAVTSATDNIITATVSDWGATGLMAALAFLCEDLEVIHDAALQAKAMETACQAGMIDMYGEKIPAIDGFGLDITCSVVTLMRECVREALKLRKTCATWFEKTLELGFFEGKA
ncbi:MAG: DUF4392 domain-containing protein [Oscillospiraceae bacterium]|jgi:hypothetical protein|nr:DUF4392 domain-containing protein [Oscillospiraceae bacterium]